MPQPCAPTSNGVAGVENALTNRVVITQQNGYTLAQGLGGCASQI
jgi:hypothetical protein